jgi:hypothetical protein
MQENIKVEFININNRAFMLWTVKKNDWLEIFLVEMKYDRGWDSKFR